MAEPPARLTVRGVLGSIGEQLLELDRRLLRTLAGLARRPGAMVREYLLRSRESVVHPLKFALAASTLNVLALGLFGERMSLPFPPMVGIALIFQAEKVERFVQFLPYTQFFLLALVALAQRALFRRRDANLAECYVLQLYAFGAVALGNVAFLAAGAYRGTAGVIAIQAAQWAYLTWAVSGFYGSRPVSTALRVLLLLVLDRVLLLGLFLAWLRLG